jgi:RNase P subunit RPR2
MKVVDCPVCGESMVKGSKSKYRCENESCPVIFVRCPSEPAKRRVAYTSFARQEIMKRIQKVTVEKTSDLF